MHEQVPWALVPVQMEKRLLDLEKRVKALEGGRPATRARSTAKKTTSTKTSPSPSQAGTQPAAPKKSA